MLRQARWKPILAGGVLLLTLVAVGTAWAMKVAEPGWAIIVVEPGSTITISQPAAATKAAGPVSARGTAMADSGMMAAEPGEAARTVEDIPAAGARSPAKAAPPAGGRLFDLGTVFYAPEANKGAIEQIAALTAGGREADAALIKKMIETPQAVWLTAGTPQTVEQNVRTIVQRAADKGAVPVLVAYNVPGRDCSQYSAGGAATGDEYKAWIDGFAAGLSDKKAVVLLEPDGLALQPADCGQPDTYGRVSLINYAAHTLLSDPNAAVYLDAGHSAWHDVAKIASRLVAGGVQDVRGFFLNSSNYQFTANSVQYGNWIASCITYAAVVSPGNYGDCPNQYYNGGPDGTRIAALAGPWTGGELNRYGEWSDDAGVANANTSGINRRYADLLSGHQPTVHFVIDTSRNGRGPWQPPADHPGSDSQDWCNPPDRGLGARPTADTGQPMVDAYLWVKIPGESDGQCYRWTGGPADPVRGMQDPAAGQWFGEMALELARNATPPLK